MDVGFGVLLVDVCFVYLFLFWGVVCFGSLFVFFFWEEGWGEECIFFWLIYVLLFFFGVVEY